MGKTINLRLNRKEAIIWDDMPKGKRSKILKESGLKSTKLIEMKKKK